MKKLLKILGFPLSAKPDYQKTGKFHDKPYLINNSLGFRLLEGDEVIVHPTEKSQSREPFKATITFEFINWVGGGCYELCTNVKGGYSAVINEYLFNRLELVKQP